MERRYQVQVKVGSQVQEIVLEIWFSTWLWRLILFWWILGKKEQKGNHQKA